MTKFFFPFLLGFPNGLFLYKQINNGLFLYKQINKMNGIYDVRFQTKHLMIIA